MNYSALRKGLFDEAFSFKQYKSLTPGIRVFAVLATLPFHLSAWSLVIAYAVYSFVFNILASSVAYLEAWLHNERKELRHATEAVLYFVAAPTIFFFHFILSLFACSFFVVWFFLQCTAYIATLGGIRFQPYINIASYGEGESEYTVKDNFYALTGIIGIAFGLLVLATILRLIGEYDLYELSLWLQIAYVLFCSIAIPCCSRKTFREDRDSTKTTELPDVDEWDDLELPEV